MTDSPPSAASRQEVTLGELALLLRRRLAWLVAGLGLGTAAAGAWLYLGALRFEARATLLFQAEGPTADLLSSLELPVGLGMLSGTSATIGGEIEALQARPLLAGVLHAEGPLAPAGRCVQLDDLARQSAWRFLRGPLPEPAELTVEVRAWPFPDDEPEGLVLSFLGPERLEVRREGWFGGPAEERGYRSGEALEVLGATLVLRAQGELAGRRFRLRCPSLTRAAAEFGDELRVREDPSGSAAVRVQVQGAEAQRVARIANRLVRAYMEENQARRRRLAGRPVEFLEAELGRVRAELDAAEQALQAFGQESGPLALPGAATEVVEKLTEVDLERAKLALSLRAAEELLARVRSGEMSSDELAALEATGTFAHDLVEPLVALVARRADLAREFTGEHPELARAEAAIAQRVGALEGVLETERWKQQEAARELDGLVQDYLRQLEGFPALQVELARHRRAVEAFTEVYLYLLGRIEQAKISQASFVPQVDVLEWAEVPYEPSAPVPALVLALGLVLGLGAGLAGAFLREYQVRPLVSAEQVEGLLGVACVELPRRGPRADEALRTLRALAGRGPRALLFVPLGRGGRRADAVSEFARGVARAGERVLLVDADGAQGRLHERFQKASTPGLSELLASAEAPEGALQKTGEAGLTLVARGSGAAPARPGALKTWLARAALEHDLVLLSAPPPARSAAAYELAGPELALVLVCADASESELARVARRLAQCGASVSAAVLQA